MEKAIFFDRDDTLIYDKGYMHNPSDLRIIPDSFKVLKELQTHGYLIFIITNQSGIGRGYFTEEQMHIFNDKMLKEFQAQGIIITEIAFCPHSPEQECLCRKPSTKLVDELCERYQINKSSSWMVGDKSSDIECGKKAKLNTYKVEKHHILGLLEEMKL